MGNYFVSLQKKIEESNINFKKWQNERNLSIVSESQPSKIIKVEEIDTSESRKDNTKVNEQDLIINNAMFIHKIIGSPLEKYEIVKNFSSDPYSEYLVTRHKELKLFRLMRQITIEEDDVGVLNEISILKKLDHPNIAKTYEFFTYRNKYYIISEYCKEGELFEKINKLQKFKEDAAAFIFFQLLEAVNYCHKLNIVHRDIRPENILIESIDRNGMCFIKVIGFEVAKIFEKNKNEEKVIGSISYIAPEILKKNYNEKCDLWSCGVVLYILLCGQPPFNGDSDVETYKKILNAPLEFKNKAFDIVSQEAIDLIKMLLDRNPETRLSAETALNHPWFLKFKVKENLLSLSEDKIKTFINNLKDYKCNYKLQQAALSIIVHNLPHT